MATDEQIKAALGRYVEHFNAGDADKWTALFAEDARQEDPVGAPPNIGRDAIRAFYDNVRAMGVPRIGVERDPIVIGNEAILCFRVTTDIGDQQVDVPFVVDHFTFDDTGLITALRAFFDPASIEVKPV